jgi:hypothetical protein
VVQLSATSKADYTVSNYSLVIDSSNLSFRYITLPCQTEKGILEELTYIFDACVYNYFLELLSLREAGTDILNAINNLYDELMNLLHSRSR